MTVSVPISRSDTWKSLRARGAFVSHEAPAPMSAGLRPRRSGRLALLAAGTTAAVLALALLPRAEPGHATPPAPDAASTASLWTDVSHPFAAYDLAGGAYARLPLRYAARHNQRSGAREDTLTYGAARPGQTFLRVAFLRRGAGDAGPASLFLDATRLAAGAGLAVTRSGLETRLGSRFGPFDVTGMSVEHAGQAAACLAFRLAEPAAAPVLGITGLACGTIGHPVDAVTLACTIDRLDLVSAGDDEALRAIFVTAERRRRDGCSIPVPVAVRLGAAEDRPGAHGLFRGPL